MFVAQIKAQERAPVRPAGPTALLLHPITANPSVADAACDKSWIKEHAAAQKFYVGGLDWFTQVTQYKTDDIAAHKRNVPNAVKRAQWARMDGAPATLVAEMKSDWEKIARQQFFNVAQGRPVFFAKAAQFILACELALADFIKNVGEGLTGDEGNEVTLDESISSGADVYRHMAIVPACWHVAGFDQDYINRSTRPGYDFAATLSGATSLEPQTIKELADGHTVTYETATAIKEFCDVPGNGYQPLRDIRARAGAGKLGSLKAAPSERPVLA